ncbi:hypothetical protein GPJ56_009503 [Histomonas meleagridis]|uniref:uncharacterized protein n=1 Tax=Histomonas meleagridis TaxID=135588 RepID=UPI00355A4C22|nr:hypothetical protein GPJ56_009503 [Histomonas meleagridis]KAH0804644.1 hypothetical protein GO595_002580 [Histomonas meleagridis]
MCSFLSATEAIKDISKTVIEVGKGGVEIANQIADAKKHFADVNHDIQVNNIQFMKECVSPVSDSTRQKIQEEYDKLWLEYCKDNSFFGKFKKKSRRAKLNEMGAFLKATTTNALNNYSYVSQMQEKVNDLTEQIKKSTEESQVLISSFQQKIQSDDKLEKSIDSIDIELKNLSKEHIEKINKNKKRIVKLNNGFNIITNSVNQQGALLQKTNEEVRFIQEHVKRINNCLSTHDEQIQELNSATTKLGETQEEFNKRLNSVASYVLEEHEYASTNFDKIREHLRSVDKSFTKVSVELNSHEEKILMLDASNREQKKLLFVHGQMLAEQQMAINQNINDIKNLYLEAEDLRDGYTEQAEKLEKIQKQINQSNKSIDEMQEHIQSHTKILNEAMDVLGTHVEILSAHTRQIAEIEDIIVSHNNSFQDVYNMLYRHDEQIKNLNIRVDKLESMVMLQHAMIHKIVDEVTNLNNRLNEVEKKVDNINRYLHQMDYKEKVKSITKLINKEPDDSPKLADFAEFILQIRSSDMEYDIDDIVAGAKYIFESK